ncbi:MULTISPECIES: 1-deoxy-D-xylulose-5-phosphate synthase [Acinetobacter]|uniref:1-deoxy-D-xylulose-5-phosphate synthase n=1 Tax=Acinetobacter TaxID=469 RepID=UPI000451D642|nr:MULTISPECIES: 1-deoxy-D-xylulose-5-phosphate synthase [Acinetobacter]EXC34789.1 1-deoxy-D-xylulose-5-phosphate synthase [Acinetobacter sp. 869535]MCM1934087.1 1-deoxy-D-xylulose-5-phosphate synthase [Acinetobacter radioresistens]MCM1951711.1 1-deoxy-D-xylulose-5-phosphate synthase [Acinetobacter radioresistens]MCU4307822.1 1-deoxy-D-xylulose-5-phosphate synthase [Acinetobacter radioresistens]MCU4516371.1 1-deoxy-D-xylulose-5-phosphate synthase [Acinetobacter radioresistens]
MLYTEIPTQRPVISLLEGIDHPQQLRELRQEQLAQVVDELRQYILYAAGQSGGHFGANLGVIELTVALHYCFNTPDDRLIWDVGHQAYPHKVLTGRREQITTIRAKDGLAAFPARDESEFDTFGVGHSSTAISAGLGMALARRYQNNPCEVVCVVGDGAMTAGMAFEAMNDAVAHDADLIVVLNDNDMSISQSTGGFAKHLAAIWEKGQFVNVDENGEAYVQPHPQWIYNSRLHQSATSAADNLFKAIGFDYFGPFDGHNIDQLVQVFNALKKRKGPRLVHIYTKKGKGFTPAEADPITYHAISKLPAQPTLATKKAPPKYSEIFGQWLYDQAAQDKRLMAITPAMCEGSGMVDFARDYPERFFDVAIAEQHAVTLAAGMACEGLKPVVAIYSTFLQRGYDQLIHDVALQNLDVTFGIDRAGLVGEDGPTHAGAYDYAYMRTIPNMIIMAPKDENECRQMLHTAYVYPGPAAVRYPRGSGLGVDVQQEMSLLELGRAELLAEFNPHHEQQISILAFGSRVQAALEAGQELAAAHKLGVRVVNMRFVKPLDEEIIQQLAGQTTLFVTVEEHAVMGGAGSAVNEFLAKALLVKPVLNLGLADSFMPQASHAQMLEESGLDALGIQRSIAQCWAKLTLHP